MGTGQSLNPAAPRCPKEHATNYSAPADPTMPTVLELVRDFEQADDDELEEYAREELGISPEENSRDEIVAEAFRQHNALSGAAHAINNRGYAAAREEYEDEISDLEDDLEEANSNIEQLQEQLDSVDSDDERVEQLQNQIEDLQEERDELREDRDQLQEQQRERTRDEYLSEFEDELAEQMTHPKIARAYALEHRDRIQVSEDGSEVEFLQIGEDIPFDARSESDGLSQLVESVVRQADDEDVEAATDTGGGSGSSGTTQTQVDEIDQAIEAGRQQGQQENQTAGLDGIFDQ